MRLQFVALIFYLFLTPFVKGWAQDVRIINNDSCIVAMDIFAYKMADSSGFYIEKKAVPGLIKHIKSCTNNFLYPADYKDSGFVIQVPSYLKRRYYAFGDGNFCINFYDTTDKDQHTIRTISIYYDFDSTYKDLVLKEVAEGKRHLIVDPVSGRKMYRFLNFDSTHAANIFVENNIIVFYYTREKQFEQELQRSILSFRLKSPQ